MARMTLGEMVDDILSDMDSDPVTLYNDTEESRQVAAIINTCYFNIVDSREWPHFLKTFTVTQTSVATPTHMTVPTDVKSIKYLKYNTTADTTYTLMKFLEPQRFMNLLDARTTGTVITDSNNIKFRILTDTAPTYYTSFDEQTLIFDSYNSAIDTTGLTTLKTQCYGMKYPSVTLADGVYFDLPTNMYNLLLAESKAAAFLVLKQVQNPTAEFFAQSQRAKFQMDDWKIRKNFAIKDFTLSAATPQPQNNQQNG
jgi:hypothetical protein